MIISDHVVVILIRCCNSFVVHVRCNYNVRQGEDKAVKEWNKQGPSSSLHEQIDAETAGGGAAGPTQTVSRATITIILC